MRYEYAGYLRTLLDPPEAEAVKDLEGIEIAADDLAHWVTRDLPYEVEWRGIPAQRRISDGYIRLTGRFEDVHRMNSLPVDDPRFWVALSSDGWKTTLFPVDVERYPILEVTYQCETDGAIPKVLWRYDGGLHLVDMPFASAWTTVARRIPHYGEPRQIVGLTLRLYATTRATQALNVAKIRFRAMTPQEAEVERLDRLQVSQTQGPRRYHGLDEFVPIGVTMDARVSRLLAERLGVSLSEYWSLALEDIIKHHHNCILLDHAAALSAGERQEVLSMAESYGIRVVPRLECPDTEDREEWQEMLEEHLAPYRDSDTVLAWAFCRDPFEEDFRDLLALHGMVKKADPNHPLTISTRFPGALPLYAPYFSAVGFSYPTSHDPWDLGEMVLRHAPLVRGQQLWVERPAHTHASGGPEWSSCPEMRLMANLSFANGARGWFNNFYHHDPVWMGGDCERSLSGPFLAFSDLWSELSITMERFNALAPMLLHAAPAPLPSQNYVESRPAEHSKLPEGRGATSSFRLKGNDFNLFFLISNDVRGMAVVDLDIPERAVENMDVYDITDFLRSRQWTPMPLKRNAEMFPGQMRVMLMGKPEVCTFWRNAIAWRLAEDDRRQLQFNLDLAKVYGLDTSEIEQLIATIAHADAPARLAVMDRARDMILNLVYHDADIAACRSSIIDATASVCACDSYLCTLVSRGQAELAREWGGKVFALAREFTHLRLELRQGRAAQIVDQCRDLTKRARKTLGDVQDLVTDKRTDESLVRQPYSP